MNINLLNNNGMPGIFIYGGTRNAQTNRSTVNGLKTTGRGVVFGATASITGDGRLFIGLPHNNRIYEGDWGYTTNSMGKDGQRIGQYARPLDEWCSKL